LLISFNRFSKTLAAVFSRLPNNTLKDTLNKKLIGNKNPPPHYVDFKNNSEKLIICNKILSTVTSAFTGYEIKPWTSFI
jgi:hypothetical protein